MILHRHYTTFFFCCVWMLVLIASPVAAAVSRPLQATGVNLPCITTTSPYRIFNDLKKQTMPFVPYELSSWNSIGRKWGGYNLTLSTIDGYPLNLDKNIYAQTDIVFFTGVDEVLLGQTYEVRFEGNGTVGITQGKLNITLATGMLGTFILSSLNTIQIFIYSTDANNRIRNIRVTPVGNTATFTSSFLNYVTGFQVLRYAFWQGLNTWPSTTALNWAQRVTPQSATQVGPQGIALEHIFELQTLTNSIAWISIPDNVTSSDYYTKMGTLIASLRAKSDSPLYVEFGNAYTVMNDLPQKTTGSAFALFMNGYGSSYRKSIIFTICYWQIQYYINAQTVRSYDYTYIDAIAFEGSFGSLDILNAYNVSTSQLKTILMNQQLDKEVTINIAYQYAVKNGVSLITYAAGPVIKSPQYGWKWRYDSLKNTTDPNLDYKNREISMASTLRAFLEDPWVEELYLDWIRRLNTIGIPTVVFSRLCDPYTEDRPFVPLLDSLNATTRRFTAIKQSITKSRVSTIPTSVALPSSKSTCNDGCVWGDCINSQCVCYQDYSGSDCSIYTSPTNNQKVVGVNLGGLADYATGQPYIDLMRISRDWICNLIGGGWGSGAANMSQISWTPEGYPLNLPNGLTLTTIMARDLQTHYDKGTYVILFQGEGTITLSQADIKAVRRNVGRIQVDIVPTTDMNNGILFTIERINSANPLRNIRVIRPGFQSTYDSITFHPMYLSKLAPYSTIRFMDWLATNSQKDKQFSGRITDRNRTYTINGAPLEDMIRLCNMLGKDIWLNVPHLASDEYILNMAQLVKSRLRSELKVYVEYSNEVWGTQFPAGNYAQTQGILMGLSTDPTQARFCYLGIMTKKISSIWRSVFGDRVKIVVSTQFVNADTTKRILQCGDTYKYVDSVAVAPYFSVPLNSSITIDSLMNTLLPQSLQTINSTFVQHLMWTKQYNLALLCYEAGQGLTGSLPIQTKSQYDLRMQSLYTSYLQVLFNNSVALSNLYTDVSAYSSYGSWGIFQYYDQRETESYKFQGVSAYLTYTGSLSRNVTYGQCANNCSGNGVCYHNRCFCYYDYEGQNCEIPKFIDYRECGYLCSSKGTCLLSSTVGVYRNYTCSCFEGYKGAYCSIPVCASNCNFQGKCSDYNVCTCFQGRKGANCEIDCGCKGHGKCSSTNNTCICDAGFYFNTTSNSCVPECNSLNGCYGPNLSNCYPQCASGTCNNGICICWPGFTGPTCSLETQINYPNNNLGINIAALSYWSTQFPFVDYLKSSSAWIPQYYPQYYNSTIAYTWNTSEVIPTQTNGYPSSLNESQIVSKLLLRDIKLRYPKASNKYLVLYDGEGLISLGFDAQIVNYRSGRIEFNVTPSTVRDNGVYLSILKTNPANPIRNIRVILKQDEYNQSQFLNQHFVDFLGHFSTIRFMDLLSTNGNPVANWNQTTSSSQDTQATGRGISIETLVNITNRSGRKAWINVPHLATDAYVTSLANYLFNNIAQNRLIYVQYSNEVWNGFFAQGNYAVDQAKALGLQNPHKFYAKRSLEIFNIFSTVFGVTTNSRLRFVVSSQSVNTWVGQQILSYPGLAAKASILAIAPYFDCQSIGNTSNSGLYATKTVDDIINRCAATLDSIDSMILSNLQLANQYGLSLATYEAGTSISEQNTIYTGAETAGLTDKFIATNSDPRMKTIYLALLAKMRTLGLMQNDAPIMLFSSVGLPSKYGSWGLLDYSEQIYEIPTHPKYAAVVAFNSGVKECPMYFLSDYTCVSSCPSSTVGTLVGESLFCL